MTSLETIYREISKLSSSDKRLILNKIISELPLTPQVRTFDFYKLKGIGKEIWDGIDAQEYINSERAKWE